MFGFQRYVPASMLFVEPHAICRLTYLTLTLMDRSLAHLFDFLVTVSLTRSAKHRYLVQYLVASYPDSLSHFSGKYDMALFCSPDSRSSGSGSSENGSERQFAQSTGG